MALPCHSDASNLKVEHVANIIYAIVGELGQRSPTNLGNNATFGLVVTNAGAVLIDPGGTYKGAKKLAALISRITEKPVKIVKYSGGQDHRWLGNSYFKSKGARIIASAAAVADQGDRVNEQLQSLEHFVGKDGTDGTKAVYADKIFLDSLSFEFGGLKFQLIATDGAHTPGDTVVWLPEERIAFTGDLVYLEPILAVNNFSDFKNWIHAFEVMVDLKPKHIVPGHGSPSDIAHARAETYSYLKNLKERISEV